MRTQGEKGAVLHLKSCQVLLQQSIAGYKVADLTELKRRVSRTKAGMPRIIPAGVRRRIREGDIQSLKLWMTLLGMYRILEFRGKLSFSTITDPGVDISDTYLERWETFLRNIFFPTLQKVFTPGSKVELPQPTPFPILKSGPQTVEDQVMGTSTVSTSFYSLVRSAKMWQANPGLKLALKELLQLWSDHNLRGIFPPIMERIGWASSNNWHYYKSKPMDFSNSVQEGAASGLAKLGFKEEAAGKVRVFAMVDPFTQWVMRPIHLAIFTILRAIPMDGTFNQTRPVNRLRHLDPKDRWFYSIDLSAATDRLPIKLQVPVMERVFDWVEFPNSKRAAQLWAELLVGRAYAVKYPRPCDRGFDLPDGELPESVTYSVGQPMGALSSWAMLALTHHAIVHWAAHRAKDKYPKANIPIAFRDYAVLGDDIAILNKFVAREYLLVLKEIGVKAGLAKSIVSHGQFYVEFAKKFFVPSGRADMLPFKEVIATLSSTLLICEFVKQHSLPLGAILTILGYGYKSKTRAYTAQFRHMNRRLRTLLIWFRSPKGAYPLTVPEWIRSSGFNSKWDIDDDHEAWAYVWEALMVEVQILMNRYYDAAEKFRKAASTAGALRPAEEIPKGTPISRHPPYLTEKLVRDDTINQFVTEPVPFSALVAPTDYNLYESTGIADATEFNRKYGVVDIIDVPAVEMPKSLIEADLFEQVFAINDESKPDRKFVTKCEELTAWIFDFDKLAQDIPTSYWPQLRAAEKPMREFIQTAKIHEIFSRIFTIYGINPRLKPVSPSDCSGNTLVVSPLSPAFIEPVCLDSYSDSEDCYEDMAKRVMKLSTSWHFTWSQPWGFNDLTGYQWYDHLETCWRSSKGLPQTHGDVSLRHRSDVSAYAYHCICEIKSGRR
jgi:hypothetical protein